MVPHLALSVFHFSSRYRTYSVGYNLASVPNEAIIKAVDKVVGYSSDL